MKKNYKTMMLLPLIFVCFLLSGCDSINVPLNYKPSIIGLNKIQKSKSVTVGEVVNGTGNDDKTIVFGCAANNYIATTDQSITKVLRLATNKALVQAGYRSTENARYILQANLLKIKAEKLPAILFQNNSVYITTIQMEFSLYDKVSKTQVWDDVYNGVGKVRTGAQDGIAISVAFNRAIDGLLKQLINSVTFRKSF